MLDGEEGQGGRAVQFQATHTYQRPAAEVLAVLTDFDRVREKYEALGHRNIELVTRDETADGGITLVLRRVVPLELPGFAKKVLSPRQAVTQTDTWSASGDDGTRTGTFEVVARGTPVRVRGTMRLTSDGKRGCTEVIDVTVDCSVPLIGGKIAGLVAETTRRVIDHEFTWTSDLLGTR